ncbi:hypothetical protein [Parendozoicomonas haliclonae]|uniref:Ricin-type beta-trefoil lectin domain protein n=1 Tax=Parendozoicomonas haliclonae TaxID=1960125 RepID=A0A1X7ADL8_9GAMM|nr:hypothetical protein [Parendozoicomonas haliclonae]SMA32170.1 Ricin-type beta-trefoil lectin domain protein [Parendozoicomonas haliclonae]
MRGIRLISHLAVVLAGLLATKGLAEDGDIVKFQLRVGESENFCLSAPQRQANNPGSLSQGGVVSVISCSDPDVSYWRLRERGEIVQAGKQGEETDWCLIRSANGGVFAGTCFQGQNDVQSWHFEEDGQLYTVINGKKGQAFTSVVPAGSDGQSVAQQPVRGSFGWVSENYSSGNSCYSVPWKKVCSRTCLEVTEQEQCDPQSKPQQNPQQDPPQNTEPSPNKLDTGNGEGDNNDPSPAPQSEDKPKEEGPSREFPGVPEEQQPQVPVKPIVSTQARWFILRQKRSDAEICMDYRKTKGVDVLGNETEFYRVVLQYCVAGRANQQWGHDIARKTIYNKGKGSGFCLTRTRDDILLTKCQPGIQSSQFWYFARGIEQFGEPRKSWGALLSRNDLQYGDWKSILKNEVGEGSYLIRPRYLEDCERVQEQCYDLVDGQLKNYLPTYDH